MREFYYLNHSPITSVHFSKNSSDFTVFELPLYEFSGSGEHLIMHIRKKDLTTWQMLSDLSKHSGVNIREFGYAGLKDKDGMTTQYISVNAKFEKKFEDFLHPKIKILSFARHENKIKTGHLKGNRFFIRLKKVLEIDALKLEEALTKVANEGFPNFFGSQRFGAKGDNFDLANEILEGIRVEKNRKKRDLYLSAFQSTLFNEWLYRRVEISKLANEFNKKELSKIFNEEMADELLGQKTFFKLLSGDVAHHYPHGRSFLVEDLKNESERFFKKEIVPTGLMPGKKSVFATTLANEIEDQFFSKSFPYLDYFSGSRRFAWTFLEDLEFKYIKEKAWFEFSFSLQKGSYATVLLSQVLKTKI
ncbi:MAG: tRNA pseudouridine(13) synthase TruD [Campylobacteraceae bacterium]|nr:tRNA pseudouridine(13) synthase TruD [Campylobacteraceae bacterium]